MGKIKLIPIDYFRPRNARLKKFMDDQGMYGDYKKLESYFLSKLQSLLCQKSNKKQTIGRKKANKTSESFGSAYSLIFVFTF